MPGSLQHKQRISTAIRAVNQEIFNTIRGSLEILLHPVIQEHGGHNQI